MEKTDLMDLAKKINHISELNDGMVIKSVYDDDFSRYGTIHEQFDISAYAPLCLKSKTESGTSYLPGIPQLEQLDVSVEIGKKIFGEIPLQVGWCRGYNDACNALEYHKSIEVIAAVTDLVLVLGRAEDIKGNAYDSAQAEIFFAPGKVVIELNPLVLHFAPIQADINEFIAIIMLPKSTNLPLESAVQGDEGFLFAKNKWLLTYPGTRQADMGAKVAMTGKRISVTTS